MDKQFNYCIGRYWDNNDGAICVYAYGSQVHYGTLNDAIEFLNYVRQQNPERASEYKIFEVKEL